VAGADDDEAGAHLDAEVERIREGALGTSAPTNVRIDGVLRRGSSVASQSTEWIETEEIDLLVTSTSANRGWQRLWRGSRATALTTQVSCPVLLVPPSFWRRSPIPLSTVAVAIERDEAGEDAWAWIERMRDGAPRPLQVTALDPDAPLLPSAREASADLLVVHESRMEVYERMPENLRTLLEHTPIPVLVLRDLPREPIRHILVAVDTGDIWYEKLGWAKRLVDRFDARVTIYHAIDLSLSGRVRREPGGEFVSGSSAWLHAGVEDKIIPAMELWLWERVRLAGLDPAHVDVRVGVHPSWFAIPAVAEKIDADLVIVAAHGERRTGRARLSRLARATLERGTYSTLVVVDRARRVAEWGEPDWSAAPRPSPSEPS
jgi:nucleotide-binding universal stress UspA family protein